MSPLLSAIPQCASAGATKLESSTNNVDINESKAPKTAHADPLSSSDPSGALVVDCLSDLLVRLSGRACLRNERECRDARVSRWLTRELADLELQAADCSAPVCPFLEEERKKLV